MRQTSGFFINFMLCAGLILNPVPAFSNPPSAHLYLETNLTDIDSTRLTLDFGELSFEELGDLKAHLGDHSDILPKARQKLRIHVFVPANLDPDLRAEFFHNIEEQFSKSHSNLHLEVQGVELDLDQAEIDARDANQRLQIAARSLTAEAPSFPAPMAAEALKNANGKTLETMKTWGTRLRSSILHYNQWFKSAKSGYTKRTDERVGSWIGKGRGLVSAAVWFGFNSLSAGAMAQVSAAFFLDWFFSKYERRVDIFKGTHRLPLDKTPLVGHAIRFYNERPLLKSWIVGNLIGFTAGSYFRFWSWFENPERTSPPWSWDALVTFTSVLGIGNLAAAFGAQGPRIMRKKGHISSRVEYYIYMSYGVMFQAGGFLYGLGSDPAVIAFATAESLVKVGLYGAARLRPWKEPRAIVFHPELTHKATEELLYRVGFEQSETTSIRREDLPEFISRLKKEQSRDWKDKLRSLASKVPGCASILRRDDQ